MSWQTAFAGVLPGGDAVRMGVHAGDAGMAALLSHARRFEAKEVQACLRPANCTIENTHDPQDAVVTLDMAAAQTWGAEIALSSPERPIA